MRPISLLVLPALAFATGLFVAPASAQQFFPTPRTVSVTGEGIVRVEPDMAVVRFGVVTEHENPEEARSRNAEASRDAMNVVRELGIPERKMRLETLRLQPKREYIQESQRWVERGFEATRVVTVEVDDLELVPTLIARVVQEGANRLEGVTYDLQSRDEARNAALQAGAQNARAKAELLAGALGAQLGQIQTINEQNFDFPRPMMRYEMDAAMASKADAAPEPAAYAPGELEVRVNVFVVFELE